MTTLPFNAKWSFAGANELQRAEDWLKLHTFGKRNADLLGVLAMCPGPTGGSKIGIRYAFEREDDWRAFLSAFPDATSERERTMESPHGTAGDSIRAVPASPVVAGDADGGFAEGARRILAGPKPISAGKIHLLGLEKVRAHFGGQWEKRAPKVEALIERAIERRLTPRDVYQKTGPLGYVILFADLSDQDAEFKCAKMAEEISRMLIGEEMGGGDLEVQTIAAEVDGHALLERVQSPGEIVRQIERVVEQERERRAATEAEPQKDEAKKPISAVHFVYRPIWDVRRSVVVNFLCTPVRRLEESAAPISALPSPSSEDARQEIDRRLIDRVIEDFGVMDRKGHHLPICMPIHFDSVSTPSRRRDLLDYWQQAPQDYRRLAIFEIIEAPEGIPQGRVAELTNTLKPYSAGVFLRVPLSTRSFSNYADAGLAALGAAIGSSSANEERLMKELHGFAEGVEKARLRPYVHGLKSFSMTLAAITSGFVFIDGDSISSVVERPEAAFRMNVEDLYVGKLSRGK